MKKCFKCRKIRELSEFYHHPRMADKHLNKCIQCTRKDVSENRSKRSSYYKIYDKNRNALVKRKNKRKEWAENNSIKIAAGLLARKAIKEGKLIKRPCEVCGNSKVDAHHDDYLRPLKIRWLCRRHHRIYHVKERDKLMRTQR